VATGERRYPRARPDSGHAGRPGPESACLPLVPRLAAARRGAGRARPGRGIAGLSHRAAQRLADGQASRARARLHGADRAPAVSERCECRRSLPGHASRTVGCAGGFGLRASALDEVWQHSKWRRRAVKRRLVLIAIALAVIAAAAVGLVPTDRQGGDAPPPAYTPSANVVERGRQLVTL